MEGSKWKERPKIGFETIDGNLSFFVKVNDVHCNTVQQW